MLLKVRISHLLYERLNAAEVKGPAYLFGYKTAGSFTLVAATSIRDAQSELLLPAGLEFLGFYSNETSEDTPECSLLLRQLDGKLACYLTSDSTKTIEYEVVDIAKETATLRVNTKLQVELSTNLEETKSLFEKLCCKVQSEFTSFRLVGSRVVLLACDTKSTLSGAPQDITVEELASYITGDDEGHVKKSKTDRNVPLDFVLYWSSKVDENLPGVRTCAPVFYHQKKSNDSVSVLLPVNTVAVLPWESPAEDIGSLLAQAICKQLHQILNSLSAEMKHILPMDLDVPTTTIFCPQPLGHCVLVTYPSGLSEEELVEQRKLLHKTFYLNLDRPLFKLSLKHWFPEDYKKNRYLINVHQGLHDPNSGETTTVQGRYAYHHYLQDNSEDNGWGCAYRSLQTIISWFRLQGYTDKPVPTHKEIQQCLVDIGDKPASFVGSRQWIGSMEVSFCLQSLIGIDSNILNVSSGAELPTKAPQIAEHFRTHGTPIMIGGGVLAHTILGINYNEESGEAKFLILDPHYTGGEDLSIIQNKGWCGWKPASFWDSTAFYNLCMPHKPRSF